MICIDLTNRTISAELESGNTVKLLFEGSNSYYYLLFIALIARRMQEIATNEEDKPFVHFISVADEVMSLAQKTMSGKSKDLATKASTMYQTWHRRLKPGCDRCVFATEPRRIEKKDREEIAALFEKEEERGGLNASYRIGRPVGMIRIKGGKVLDELLNRDSSKGEQLERTRIPLQIPSRPYYEGLEIHEGLIKNILRDLKGRPAGQPLLVWGMGGLGKTTITAELTRRYVEANANRGVLWVQLETPAQKIPTEKKSLKAQIAKTLVAQLGLLDMIHAPANIQLTEAARTGVLSQCLLIIDNLDPENYRTNELTIEIEEIQFEKIVINSRVSLDIQYCQNIKVPPLNEQDAVRFLRVDADRRGISHVLPKTNGELIKIYTATGGLPYAMQLALGQATRLPWHIIVERRVVGVTELYNYLFRNSWKILDPVAQKTLIYMRTSPEGVGLDELLGCEKIGTADQITSAVDQLVKLALMDVRCLDERSAVYAIHPLTCDFLNTDLHRIWSEEDGKQR